MCVRWRHRAFFVVLTVVGVVVAVGANPYDDPSVLGGLFKSFAESSSFGLALRSTGRAVPLVALGLAVLLGVGVNAVGVAWQGRGRQVRGVPVRTLVVAGVVIVLAVVNLPGAVDRHLLHRRTSPATRPSRSTGPTPSPRSTPARTTRACSRSPAPTSPRTAGARPSTRSRPGSWTGRTSPASWCRGDRRRRPTCSTRSTTAPGGHARPVGARARSPGS